MAITKFLGVTANIHQVLGVTATKSHLPKLGHRCNGEPRNPQIGNAQRAPTSSRCATRKAFKARSSWLHTSPTSSLQSCQLWHLHWQGGWTTRGGVRPRRRSSLPQRHHRLARNHRIRAFRLHGRRTGSRPCGGRNSGRSSNICKFPIPYVQLYASNYELLIYTSTFSTVWSVDQIVVITYNVNV